MKRRAEEEGERREGREEREREKKEKTEGEREEGKNIRKQREKWGARQHDWEKGEATFRELKEMILRKIEFNFKEN